MRKNYASIDIMRGVAILMVIVVHMQQVIVGTTRISWYAQYGQMGVQLFFVASAFTLCNSYDGPLGAPHKKAKFWLRRYFRIAPGYYTGILLYFIASCVFGYHSGAYTARNVVANVFFVNGLYPPANNNIVPGGWSIGTEMLFYVLFPALFRGYSRIRHTIVYYLVPVVSLAANYLVVLVLSGIMPSIPDSLVAYLAVNNNSFSYYSVLAQLPVFLVGMSLYHLHRSGHFEAIHSSVLVVGFAFLTSCGFYAFFHHGLIWRPFLLIPFLTATGMASLFLVLERFHVAWPPLRRVGLLSYSGYLVSSFFIFVVAARLSPEFHLFQGNIGLLVALVLFTLIILVCADVLHRTVENNGIKLGRLVISKLDEQAKPTI